MFFYRFKWKILLKDTCWVCFRLTGIQSLSAQPESYSVNLVMSSFVFGRSPPPSSCNEWLICHLDADILVPIPIEAA